MSATVNRRAALVGLMVSLPVPLHAEPAPKPKAGEEFAVLDQPAQLDINSQSGNLKETVQKGQQLIWHLKDNPSERRFQITNIAIAFLRSETGGQVKMSFACKVSALGYQPADEVKLNVIVRSKGGAALHAWSFGIPIKCADKDQAITPVESELPTNPVSRAQIT